MGIYACFENGLHYFPQRSSNQLGLRRAHHFRAPTEGVETPDGAQEPASNYAVR